jgi:hypothetical protein
VAAATEIRSAAKPVMMGITITRTLASTPVSYPNVVTDSFKRARAAMTAEAGKRSGLTTRLVAFARAAVSLAGEVRLIWMAF